MMGREKDEEMDMGDNFEGVGAPVTAATPPPATEPVANPGATPDGSKSEATAKTSEELQQARDESWARGEIPDEVLENGKGGSPADAKHSLRLRRPRAGYSEESGVVFATLNLSALKEKNSGLYDEAVAHGLISIKNGVEGVDVYSEFGGSSEYSDFAIAEAQKTSGRTIRLEKARGYVPEKTTEKETVTAEMIAHAYESWKANKRVQDLLKKAIDVQNASTQPAPDANQPAATAADSQPVEPQTADAGQSAQEEARKKAEALAAQIEEAQKAAEAAQKAVDQDAEELKKIRQENKVINDVEALNLLNAIETYSLQEKDLREKLKTASAEEKNDLEEQLSEVRRQKAEVMLTAIGYSEENAAIIFSHKNNLDSDLALFLRLAKHTSLSKEQNSPNIIELNRVVKMELLQSITDLLNKDKPEGGKQTFEQIRMMKAGEALRAAMKALGFDEETQNKKVKELFESANSPERKLNTSEDDPLHTMIEALVSGKPSAEMEKDAKSWFKKMEEEFRKAGGKVEDFPKWLERKINEVFHGTYNPEFAESVGLFFTMLLTEYLDVGAFMEMLLVGGDHFSSLAHDLGYKSKEQLLKEGKHPIDEHEVDAFIRKNDAKATNARGLLCAGLEDIIPKDVVEKYLHNPSPSAVLKDESFTELLKIAFSKEYHKKFSQNLLKVLGYTEKEQENSHIELTHPAMTFIMSLPEVAQKGNWTDDGESGGEKMAEGKGGEADEGDRTEKLAAQPSGAAQTEQPQTSQQ